jgi:hypothetical protein
MTEVQSEAPAAIATKAAAAGEAAPLQRVRWTEAAKVTRKTAAAVGRQTEAAGSYSAAKIRAKPLLSTAIALGTGLLIGALLFG